MRGRDRKIEAFNHTCDSRRAKKIGKPMNKNHWPKSIFCIKSLHFLCSRIIELTFNAVLPAASLLLHATPPLYTQWASLCRGHFPPGQHFHRTFPLSHKTRQFLQTHFIFMFFIFMFFWAKMRDNKLDRDHVVVSRSRLRVTYKAFSIAGPRAWNALPSDMKLISSRNQLPQEAQDTLFQSHLSWSLTFLFSTNMAISETKSHLVENFITF